MKKVKTDSKVYYHSHEEIPVYNGNPNLKDRDVKMILSPTEQEEFIKCALDPVYFIEKYVKLVHIDKGIVPMLLYPYQKKIVAAYLHNKRMVINQSRQSGKTSAAVAVLLHYIIFNSAKTVGLLANKESSAIEILSRMKLAYEYLPKWLQHGVIKWAEKSIEIDNKCKVITSATQGSAIRGKSCSFLYIDEHAFIENYEDFASSVLPTISSGKESRLLLTSTPNGLNHFYSIFTKAKQKKNNFWWIEVPWWEVPGRNEAWKQETLETINYDMDKFRVEYEGQFEGSSGTLISGSALKNFVGQTPIASNEGLRVYENPIKGHSYTLVADVARGSGGDYSAFQVIDTTTMPFKQVATYQDNTILPPDYAEVINRVGRVYNMAYVLVEINDIGGQVADILFSNYEYDHLLCTENAGRAGKKVSFGNSRSERGVRTTKTVKGFGCSMLKMIIEQQQLIINDKGTIEEFTTFSKTGDTYKAEVGKHDDLVMGLVLFAWLTQQEFFRHMNETDVMGALKSKTEEDIDDMFMPFGFNNHDDEDDNSFLNDAPATFKGTLSF